MKIKDFQSACKKRNQFKRILFSLLLPVVVASLFFILPPKTFAANGARIGGSNFSSPAIPRSRNYENNFSFNSRSSRNGIGLPFFLPIYGIGGGAFGFLLLLGISGVIINSLRRGINISNSDSSSQTKSENSTLVQLQVALLPSSKDLKETLNQLAESTDTSHPKGLRTVLAETTLALLREPDLWVYANVEHGVVPWNTLETTFNRLSINERSKLKAESISNVSGKINKLDPQREQMDSEEAINEFIVLSILVASRKTLSIQESISSKELNDNLKTIGAISEHDLLALEIIWQPEGNGEILSTEGLITSYPNMKHL